MSKHERNRRGDDARVDMQPARDARADLKETAIDCFARFGYQGTSIDRIAREAGVTKGAIYYHYKDKDDLLAAAVADRIAEFEDRVQRAVEGCGAEESLRRVVAVAVAHAASDDRPRFAIKLMVEAIETHEILRDSMRRMMQRYRAFVRNLIRKGQESGDFRADADAEGLAATLTSACIGAETQFYLDPERFRLEETLDVFINQICRDLRAAERTPGLTRNTAEERETPA